jgi:glycerate 2-kinase
MSGDSANQPTAALRRMFAAALATCAPDILLRREIRIDDGILYAGSGREPALAAGADAEMSAAHTQIYELRRYRSILVISLGKAAASMLHSLAGLWPVDIAARAILCAPPAPASPNAPVAPPLDAEPRAVGAGLKPAHTLFSPEVYLGGHPEPNAGSLAAARALLHAVAGIKPPGLVIYLVSGGGSAIVEAPLDADLTLDDLRATYRALVTGGAPIDEMNVIRRHLSAIKGGRLAAAVPPGIEQLSLILSDVPPARPEIVFSTVSSGPTSPDPSTVEDCYRIHARHRFAFPPAVERLFRERRLAETPARFHGMRAQWVLLGDNAAACAALAEAARREGYDPVVDAAADEWEYRRAAEYLLSRFRQLRAERPRVCLIAGGEVLVKVESSSAGRPPDVGDPAVAGAGGRNQQFALFCATRIAGDSIAVLSAATDGVDGNSAAAGAAVDGGTTARARGAGFDAVQALQQFNAAPLLAAAGDAILIGPSGNNLRDLRALV